MQTGRAKSNTATKLKRALRESEERLDRILRGSNDGFWDWDVTTGELYLSPRWLEILGYHPSDLEPHFRTLEELCHSEDLPTLMGAFNAHLEGGAAPQVEIEHRVRTKSGNWKWILTRGCVGARDEFGQAVHMAGTATDITSRRQAEEDLREHRDLLDELVAQRTMELAETNARLQSDIVRREQVEEELHASNAMLTDGLERERQITKQLEIASVAKGEFLANMSHELRTPLNVVIGAMELLLSSELDTRQRRYAWLAKSSGDALLSLIKDVLDFSKIEAGKLDLEAVDFDLHYALESVAAAMGSRAENKGLELICGIHPDVPAKVKGDPGRFQQILLNLLGNAIKFTERGEVIVRAVLEKETEHGAIVCVTVNDTGIGIPLDRQEQLFDSFTQADTSTTRKFGGTGLGLAISEQLVEMMGGRIGVMSEPGQGSTFWFTVPFEKQVGASKSPCPILDDVRRVRVLGVDDNAVNREILHEQLQHSGLDHETSPDGEHALTTLRQAAAEGAPFGLAILDTQMSGMDVEELARAIKTDPALKDTALLLLTSTDCNDPEGIRSLGFAGWLAKPVRQSQLMGAIAETLACAQAKLGRSVKEAIARSRECIPAAKTKGARILLAEDHEIGREIASATLTQAGYRCDVVGNGKEAVEAVMTGSYDLVLMDCLMPVMDGYQATREIRNRENSMAENGEEAKRFPIVALTANAIMGDRERCLEAGMDDYISKPLEPRRLFEVIESQLVGAKQRYADITNAESQLVEREKRVVAPTADCAAEERLPFDIDVVLERWNGDRKFAAKLIEKFCSQAPSDLERLEQCALAGEVEEATRLAHGLKGGASYVGAERFREIAAELERMGRDGDLGDSGPVVGRLKAELRRCRECDLESLTGVGPPCTVS